MRGRGDMRLFFRLLQSDEGGLELFLEDLARCCSSLAFFVSRAVFSLFSAAFAALSALLGLRHAPRVGRVVRARLLVVAHLPSSNRLQQHRSISQEHLISG